MFKPKKPISFDATAGERVTLAATGVIYILATIGLTLWAISENGHLIGFAGAAYFLYRAVRRWRALKGELGADEQRELDSPLDD